MSTRPNKRDQIMSIKAQLREIRYSGAIVRSRKGKWRVKDPSGIIHEEPIPTEDKLSDDSVRCFAGRAFRNYAYRVLSADQAIIGFAGSQATWKQGDLILMAKANSRSAQLSKPAPCWEYSC